MKNKHDIEIYFLELLKKLYPDIPDGKVTTPDPPDFIIEADGKTIAVEITEIHNQKLPSEKFMPAQKYSIEDQIVERAMHQFYLLNNLPLHVTFFFTDTILVKGNKVESVAQRICCLIESYINSQTPEKYFSFVIQDDLPDELICIRGQHSPNIDVANWYSPKSKFLPNLSKTEILNTIRKKEKKINQYRSKVSTAILVIAEGLIPNSWFHEIENIDKDEIESEFDKIFLIRSSLSQLMEIK